MLRTKLPPKTPEYLAALRAAQPHGRDPRIATALAAAAQAKDPEIVRAATRRETIEAETIEANP